MYEPYQKYLEVAAERAATRPEVATAHALVAIAMLLEQANFVRGNY